jgi:colicin import membrane protein
MVSAIASRKYERTTFLHLFRVGDLEAIAAPSMKAALEAWGAGCNLFHQGVAKESSDPEVIAATMSKPGVVLRRPVGSDAPFSEHPTCLRSWPMMMSLDTNQRRPLRDRRSGCHLTPMMQPAKPPLRLKTSSDGVKNQRRKEEAVRKKQRERRDRNLSK